MAAATLTVKKTQLAVLVREARARRKLSQVDVASALGASVGFVGKVERGQTGVKAAKLKPLAKVLRVPVKALVAAKVADLEAGIWQTIRAK